MKKVVQIFMVVLMVFGSVYQGIHAQDKEKIRLRVKADYVKVMNDVSYLEIVTSARIEKRNQFIPNISLTILSETDEDEIELGSVVTNHDGKARFIIDDLNKALRDSLGYYTLTAKFKGNDDFKRASRSVTVLDASIVANWVEEDSINYVSASLKDVYRDSLVTDTSLDVNVERLFRSLPIGEEFNYTDENGSILVEIQEGIPGIDGNLVLEVVLNDHDEYGTVIAKFNAPVGEPIVVETDFENRTLWASRDKTPWFILIFTNLLIVGMWGIFVYLVVNLFKIRKL